MKKFYFLMSLITFGLFVNSCKPAYVSVRPTYLEVSRSNRPSNKHIWINGDWVWNNQTKTYIRQDSYWTIPSEIVIIHKENGNQHKEATTGNTVDGDNLF